MSTFCSHHASALSRHSSSSIIIRPRNFGFGNYKLPVLSESSPVYSKMMKHVADDLMGVRLKHSRGSY